ARVVGRCLFLFNKIGGGKPPPQSNTLKLKKLDAASQAGRVVYPGQTRGQKSDRLQFVAKISPVNYAADNNWSATGIAIQDGMAYVSWHSNRQTAENQATTWGGALDVISISELEQNGASLQSTLVATEFKFNNVVASGSDLYFPLTSYNKGAVVGRLANGATEMDTIAVPGVSANAIAVDGANLRVVTGYKGGVFTVPTSAFGAEVKNITTNIAESEDFGGKYIVGDRVLRSNDEGMQIVALDGTVRNNGAALVSTEKQAETYNPETGQWTLVQGTNATHYGKHTMAVDGNHIYVGGGVGSNGENGLRVYAATGLVWQNGTNTTAVCVDDNYVYAATGAGLRVYEKFNGTDLPLYAFEVLNYDENGMAAPDPETNKPVAGTDAHSNNFVAVAGEYIFVACGQSGVYVFKLNTAAEPSSYLTGITAPGYNDTKEVLEDEEAEFTTPDAPETEEDEYFDGWKGNDGNTYEPKKTITLGSGNVLELTPVIKKYELIVEFDGNVPEGKTLAKDVPATIKSKETSVDVPAAEPSIDGMTFLGWHKNPGVDPALVKDEVIPVIKAGDKVVAEGDNKKVTLYAVWITNADASGTQGGEKEPEPDPEPEGNGGGAGDPNNGNLN
ncbi:MAG: hypothetical protein K2G29_03735, partial [Muribaculaceae bacterium]|nr:hypothetical protein [Muribaculaceae bacterium]